MHDAQLTNLIGALALALADAQLTAVKESGGISAAGCSALVVLGHYPRSNIRELAAIVGLSHSVMVRTIEGLVNLGTVSRQRGDDKREAILDLTDAGRKLRLEILKAREMAVGGPLVGLAEEEKLVLHRAVKSVLLSMATSRTHSNHLCRLCDEVACGLDCPIEEQARCKFDLQETE